MFIIPGLNIALRSPFVLLYSGQLDRDLSAGEQAIEKMYRQREKERAQYEARHPAEVSQLQPAIVTPKRDKPRQVTKRCVVCKTPITGNRKRETCSDKCRKAKSRLPKKKTPSKKAS